jgi:hypothetical protein
MTQGKIKYIMSYKSPLMNIYFSLKLELNILGKHNDIEKPNGINITIYHINFEM